MFKHLKKKKFSEKCCMYLYWRSYRDPQLRWEKLLTGHQLVTHFTNPALMKENHCLRKPLQRPLEFAYSHVGDAAACGERPSGQTFPLLVYRKKTVCQNRNIAHHP
ncbi:hypothetical protein ATANTOWER_024179 [Ataeniobius toweri]|uniref:Uncharacterized protein n=1 Tax=Ataeniobius toweri TaxID=208326 RepID=A0ABU7C162_9TELE|nr:hypothetical protein [Ataeniobius toweri]